MKTVFLSRPIEPPWDEGSKNFAMNLAKNIEDTQIKLLTLGKFKLKNCANVSYESIYTKNKLDFSQKIKYIKYLINTHWPNIVHFFFTPTLLNSNINRAIINFKKFKSVQTIPCLPANNYSQKELKKIFFCDYSIVISNYSYNKLKNLGIKNVELIRVGVASKEKDINLYNIKEYKSKLGIKKDDFVIVYPGEYYRLGGASMLVEAMEDLKKTGLNFKIIFACLIRSTNDVRAKNDLKKIISKKRLDEYVIYLDFVEDMNRLFTISNICVFPAKNMDGKYDTPMAVLEAMALGVPVILSNINALNELSVDGASILMNNNTPKDLVKEILLLKKHEEYRNELGSKGKKLIKEQNNFKYIAKQYEKLYKTL